MADTMKNGVPVRLFINGRQSGGNNHYREFGESLDAICQRLQEEMREDGFQVDSCAVENLREYDSSAFKTEPEPTIVLKVSSPESN